MIIPYLRSPDSSVRESMLHFEILAGGGLTPLPVRSALRHFPEDFTRPTPETQGERA